ncbi:class I SAM-dependent methyltransferase [Stieleria sp. JC731]|uniref:class I SAM-dependent methyltransferase n=1 Tax=Roseiconus sp. JC912 TaxID=3396307 RepID=UPI003A4C6394|nr:class I SAM-dependent methyltransferase [Stieleria sp. JC731]
MEEFYASVPASSWDYNADQVGSWNSAKTLLRSKFDFDRQFSIVDIGAFDGRFLETLPKHWRKAAIEPCANVRQSLLNRQIEWLADYAENVSADHHLQYDVATMFDVFEHLADPTTTVRNIVSLLRPGGFLILSTGDASHWTWKLLGGHHWYLHTAQHLCFATPKSIRWLANQTGLVLRSMTRHPHQNRSRRTRLRHVLETLHWHGRIATGNRRRIAGLIQRIPRQRHLIHRDRPPMAVSLCDHMLVCFQKAED